MSDFQNNEWEIRSRVWLEKNGVTIIGEGRLAILQAIDSFGSLTEAARETGISYRRIRGAIREMESAIGRPLVLTARGGQYGGGAKITAAGYEMIDRFRKVLEGNQETVNTRFRDIFS
ncbi:MAG: LysR family transcriptional regulator [Pseudomonadota bacterium]